MLEPYEKALDQAAVHLKTVSDPDPTIRMRSVLAFTQCIGPYCPTEVAVGITQVMADVIADVGLWTKEDSALQELIRVTMARIRQNELAKLFNKKTEEAISAYIKEKKEYEKSKHNRS
tara:strand:+ start:578 stop:931 length:354 start_codon:yes stop_codon:yes gene_type:complete